MYGLDIQLDTYKWMVNYAEPTKKMISSVLERGEGGGNTNIGYGLLLAALRYGETFHVDKDWTYLLNQARADLAQVDPIPVLHPTDMMARKGFAYFETPVIMEMIPPDKEQTGLEFAPVQGLAWSTHHAIQVPRWVGDPVPVEDLVPGDPRVTYSTTAGVLSWLFVDTVWLSKAIGLDPYPPGAPLSLYDMVGWGYGVNLNEVRPWGTERPPFTIDEQGAEWRRMAYSFWTMSNQYVTLTKAARHARRRWEREFDKPKPDHGTVRHVILRRAKSSGQGHGSGEGFEYSHRFTVRGHWRNQWYPSLGVHKPVWIDPFVKGPEDKPFVVKHQVFDVKR